MPIKAMLVPLSSTPENQKLSQFINAINQNNIAQTRELLREGMSPNAGIFRAIDLDSPIQMLKLLIEFNVDVNIEHGTTTNTPLMIAAQANRIKLCRLLIQHGAEINKTNRWGKTALYFAGKNNHIAVCKLLLEHGATIDEAGPQIAQENPFHCKVLVTHARFCPHLSQEQFKNTLDRLRATLLGFHRFGRIPKEILSYIFQFDPDFQKAFFTAGVAAFGNYDLQHAPFLPRQLVTFLIRNGTLPQEYTVQMIKTHHLLSVLPLAKYIYNQGKEEYWGNPSYQSLDDNYGGQIETNIKNSLGISPWQCIMQ